MSAKPGGRPTGRDVAALAGVAQSSVSLVLSGKATGRISPVLERRIRQAAETLGYEPIHSGRALRSGEVRALGLVVTDFENAFYGPVSRGAQEAAAQSELSVVLMETRTGGDGGQAPVRSLDGGLVDGLLIFAVDPPAPTSALTSKVTLLEVTHPDYSSVVFDSDRGMRRAIEFLAQLGHRSIGYAGVDNRRWTFERRRAAWESAMISVEVPIRPDWTIESPIGLEPAAAAARRLLGRSPRPTAVVCADDLIAAGVYRAAAESALSIPDDLSVVSFGGTIVGDVLSPPVTTLHASGRHLGRAAVEMYLGGLARPEHRLLPVELQSRGSTAPPRRPA